MSRLDYWNDAVADKALRLLRLAEVIVRHYRQPAEFKGVRPTTIDRFLVDVSDFNTEHLRVIVDAEAEADGEGEEGAVVDHRPVTDSVLS